MFAETVYVTLFVVVPVIMIQSGLLLTTLKGHVAVIPRLCVEAVEGTVAEGLASVYVQLDVNTAVTLCGPFITIEVGFAVPDMSPLQLEN